MDNQEVISTLNELIETCRDGEQGFYTCAEGVNELALKKTFTHAAQRCAEAAKELQDEVQRLGGDPEKRSSAAGTLHRTWVDIKSVITGKDEAAILAECERGEDVAVASYLSALDKELPSDIRAIVERQFHGVKKNHDHIRSLRDRYRQAS